MNYVKSIKVLAPLCASVLLLSACGNKDRDDGGIVDKGIMREKVTISFGHNYGKDKVPLLDDFIKSFKEVEPNITVKSEFISGDYGTAADIQIDRLFVNKHCDIFYCYPDVVANFIDYGFAYDIQPFIDNPEYGLTAEEKADFVPSFFDEGTNYYLPGTYSLPWSKSTELMFYDARILELPELPREDGLGGTFQITENYMNELTWDELFENLAPALLKATEPGGPGDGLLDRSKDPKWAIVGHDSGQNLFITLAQQYGYDYTEIVDNQGVNKFNNPGMKELMKKFNGYYKDRLLTTKEIYDGFTNDLTNKDAALISIGSTAGVEHQFSADNPKDIKVARVPQAPDAEKAAVISQGPSVTFLSHKINDKEIDKNRQLASWLFYKHCMSEANSWTWAKEAKYIPVRKSAYENKEYENMSSLTGKEEGTLEMLKARVNIAIKNVSDSYFSSPVFVGSKASREAVGSLLTDCLKEQNLTDAKLDSLFEKAVNDANSQLA